jgi:anti-anti-sigma regulatory factor
MEPKADLSLEMYHRIYRLANRKVDAQRIAATLNLSHKTVQNVLHRLVAAEKKQDSPQRAPEVHKPADEASFLDIYVYQKTRYTVVDLSGFVIESHCARLQSELAKLIESGVKTAAIMITDVQEIDQQGLQCIIEFHKSMKKRGRFVALLDPPRRLEPFIAEHEVEERVPIFGTEQSFEDKAFAVKRDSLNKR